MTAAAARSGDETTAAAGPVVYEAALDGLRAFAIGAVVLYHAGLTRFGGGFLGVDVFFVVSGYLITSLLLAEYGRSGRIGLRGFWSRRARRLLPALVVALLGVALYALVFATAEELHGIRVDAFATLFYVQNWRLIFSHQSYFAGYAAPSPLRHAWSLSIEEQFYLVWPLIVVALLRLGRGRRAVVAAVAAAGAALSAVFMAVRFDPFADPSRVYYGTDARAHTILIGALLACIWPPARARAASRSRRALVTADVVAMAGAAVIAVLVLRAHATAAWLYRGGFLLVAVASACLIAGAVAPGGLLRKLLAWPPLVALGRVSYGVYLWHWPVDVVLARHLDGARLFLASTPITLALAALSYRFVEQPVRAGRVATRAWRVLLPAGSVVALLAIVGATVGARAAPVQYVSLGDAYKEAFKPFAGAPNGRPRILAIGDSVMLTLAFSGLNMPPGVGRADYVFHGVIGCGILPGPPVIQGRIQPIARECGHWPRDWARIDAIREPDVTLLQLGPWDVYDHLVDGHVVRSGSREYSRLFERELARAARVLTARGSKLVVFTVPCMSKARADVVGGAERANPERVARVNRAIAAVAHADPGNVHVLDIGTKLCPGGHYAASIDGVYMRADGVHFTTLGRMRFWSWFGPEIESYLPAGESRSRTAFRARQAATTTTSAVAVVP